MSGDDSEAWTRLPVASVCERVVVGFVGPAKQHYVDGTVPFLMGKNVRNGTIDLSSLERVTRTFHDRERKSQLEAGDVIVVRIGRSGEAAVVPPSLGPANCGGLVVIKKPTRVLPEFLAKYLNSPEGQRASLDQVRGVTRQTLNTSSIAAAEVPVPPLAEQKRIVAKLEELTARSRRAMDALEAVPDLLDHLRQSILAAAFRGDLTADWRARSSDGTTAKDLISRLSEPRNESPKPTPSMMALSEGSLPSTWAWSTLGELFEVSVGATPSRAEAKYWEGEIPWVSSGEVAFCRISRTRETITASGLANSSAKLHPPGTVLLAMIGEGRTRGQAAILDIAASNNQNCAAIRVSQAGLPPEYVYHYLALIYRRTREVGSGNNQQALNKARVQQLPIPVPPLDEQLEIVSRLGPLLAATDTLEKSTRALALWIADLDHALLARAFCGQLVSRSR